MYASRVARRVASDERWYSVTVNSGPAMSTRSRASVAHSAAASAARKAWIANAGPTRRSSSVRSGITGRRWWKEIASEMKAKLTATNAAPPMSASTVIVSGLSVGGPEREDRERRCERGQRVHGRVEHGPVERLSLHELCRQRADRGNEHGLLPSEEDDRGKDEDEGE